MQEMKFFEGHQPINPPLIRNLFRQPNCQVYSMAATRPEGFLKQVQHDLGFSFERGKESTISLRTRVATANCACSPCIVCDCFVPRN